MHDLTIDAASPHCRKYPVSWFADWLDRTQLSGENGHPSVRATINLTGEERSAARARGRYQPLKMTSKSVSWVAGS